MTIKCVVGKQKDFLNSILDFTGSGRKMISDLGSSVNTCVEVKDEMHRKLDELYF